MRIIGPPSATKEKVLANVQVRPGVHARFINEMFEPLWAEALYYGIDPVGVIAQSGKETAWGNFTGNVQPGFFNTGGIKVRNQPMFPGVTTGDNPLAHQMFANWQNGAEAHVQHLRAYAGWPVTEVHIVDPRYQFVNPALRLENFEDLGGKWAPSASYGVELVAIARQLQA